ncbi:unnamed protein product [Durusdinium trenchii]|uniref:Pentatricopeptide repeat-containing protein n=1 Tax=Durusdinium trenchii TaxID=1381693 RepID=A0ABP0RSV2_9DINO
MPAPMHACGGHQWQMAMHIFSIMDMSQRDLLSYGIALNSCDKGHRWQQAIEFFQSIRGVDVVCFNSTLSACTKGQAWLEALELLRSAGLYRLEPDVVSYGTAIGASSAAGWPMTLHLFADMDRQRIERNATVYNATISACVAGQHWKLALHFFHAMPFTSDVYTYNATISALELGNRWEMALHFFSSMPKAFLKPTVVSYNAVLAALKLQWPLALALASEMCERSVALERDAALDA